MNEWKVTRDSGRTEQNAVKVRYVGTNETHARELYQKLMEEMRQGAVNLFCDDKIIKSHIAYRNRTRW